MTEISKEMEMALLRSYLQWAIAQIEYMNDGHELSFSEWDEDAAMFIQAKELATSKALSSQPQKGE